MSKVVKNARELRVRQIDCGALVFLHISGLSQTRNALQCALFRPQAANKSATLDIKQIVRYSTCWTLIGRHLRNIRLRLRRQITRVSVSAGCAVAAPPPHHPLAPGQPRPPTPDRWGFKGSVHTPITHDFYKYPPTPFHRPPVLIFDRRV